MPNQRRLLSSNAIASPSIAPVADTPFGVLGHRLTWADDPQACLYFVLQPQSAYILGIERGQRLSGSDILRAFAAVAESRRVKVVGVSFDSLGFWEKMVERQLVNDWCLDDAKSLLG